MSFAEMAIAAQLVTRGGFAQKNYNIDAIANIFKLAFKNVIRKTKIIINDVCQSYQEFFVQSVNEVQTPMRYAYSTDLLGIQRFPGIKRRPIYNP